MSKARKMFVHVSGSFKESDKVMAAYYASLTCEEKLDIGQYLREQYYKIKGGVAGRMDKTIIHVSRARSQVNGRAVREARGIEEK